MVRLFDIAQVLLVRLILNRKLGARFIPKFYGQVFSGQPDRRLTNILSMLTLPTVHHRSHPRIIAWSCPFRFLMATTCPSGHLTWVPPMKACSHRAALIWEIFVDCTFLSLILQSVHLHGLMQGWQLGNLLRQTAAHIGRVGA